MKKFVVTEDSLEKANQIVKLWNLPGLDRVLAFLFVPEDEADTKYPEYRKLIKEMLAWLKHNKSVELGHNRKPFGPGTRLRAANGDELMVIGDGIDGEHCIVVNLTKNCFGPVGSWYLTKELEERLNKLGATVIEEEE